MQQMVLGRGQAVVFSLALAGALLGGCSGNTSGDNTGGTGGVGGASGGSGGGLSQAICEMAGAFVPVDPTALLDDLEDGNGLIAPVATRNGSWWISTDMSGGTTTPIADAAPSPEKILGGRCGSKMAMRVTGQGFTNWGAVMSVGMAYSSHPDPVDLSSFKGLRLWARVGEQNTSAIRVQFQDSHTEPNGGECIDIDGDPEACYNGFGTALPVTTQWQLFELNFSRMSQRDFGHRADALDTAHIYDVEFNLEPNAVFDLWVDDLWFFD